MAHEEVLMAELEGQFHFLVGRVRMPRERRIFVELPYHNFAAVFEYAVRSMHFSQLITITGLDEGETLGLVYHLGRARGLVLSIKTAVPKHDPQVESVTPLFPGGAIYEQELVDLLGFQVNGLPPLANRYPLQDDWPAGQYPLRKDWSPESLKDPALKPEKGA